MRESWNSCRTLPVAPALECRETLVWTALARRCECRLPSEPAIDMKIGAGAHRGIAATGRRRESSAGEQFRPSGLLFSDGLGDGLQRAQAFCGRAAVTHRIAKCAVGLVCVSAVVEATGEAFELGEVLGDL
jgi:hypothetical protein